MLFNCHIIFKRLKKTLIRLCECVGLHEPLLVAHTTLLEISRFGSCNLLLVSSSSSSSSSKAHLQLSATMRRKILSFSLKLVLFCPVPIEPASLRWRNDTCSLNSRTCHTSISIREDQTTFISITIVFVQVTKIISKMYSAGEILG